VAVDSNGHELGSVTVPTTSAGHLEAVTWVAQFGEHRMWALEDCGNTTRRLESELLAAGETVIRVPAKLMAGAREAGKSDPIDAAAVARAALREPKLPPAHLDGPAREMKLLVDYREALIRERTAAQNRLRWRLHELEPEFDPPPGSLSRYRGLDRTMVKLGRHSGLVTDLASREVTRNRAITRSRDPFAMWAPGSLPSQSGRGTPTGIDSTVTATVKSTPHCTALRSPSFESTPMPRPTSSSASRPATRRRKPSESSNGDSPTSFTDHSSTTQHRPPPST
jgi:hypothetical protein